MIQSPLILISADSCRRYGKGNCIEIRPDQQEPTKNPD
jgi:hypothetical protein